MTPCLKIWESLTNLEGHNFFFVSFQYHESKCIVISYGPLKKNNNNCLLEHF